MSDSTHDDPDPESSDPGFDDFVDPLSPLHVSHEGSPLREGDVLLGRFHLVRQFTGNAESVVWLAWEIALRRFVVLKFVRSRLLEEARRAAAVAGNVITVHEYNTTIPDNPFLVMEAALGGQIDRLAAVWKEDPALLIAKFIPVIRTLVSAHNTLGTVHRDLKPGNLLLWMEPPVARDEGFSLPSPSGRGEKIPALPDLEALDPRIFIVKIADWGLSTEDGDAESQRGGTPGFAAPEQWSQPATPAADVFGAAATLYFLLTDRHVMPATHEFALQLRAGTATYTPPSPIHELNAQVDPRLSRIVMRSLAENPAARHTSADALATELERWLTGYSIAGDSRTRQLALWSQRYWGALGAASVVILLGIVISLYQIHNAHLREDAEASRADSETARADANQSMLKAAETEQRQREAAAISEQVILKLQLANEREKQLAELTVAARNAARRGDWSTALRLYDRLIKVVDPEKARRLRVERLFGYFAVNDEPALVRELDSLEAEPNLGPLAARVKLVRGAQLLCDAQAARGLKLIAQSLDERRKLPESKRDELYPAADALYAEALVKNRPRPTIEMLRKVVDVDALHYPAHSALVFALIATGDADAALLQAKSLGGLFPESPLPAYVRINAALLVGDRTTMRAEIAEFGKKARTDTRQLSRYFELFADALDLMEKYNLTKGGLTPLQVGGLFLKLNEMHAIQNTALRPVTISTPTVYLFNEWREKVFNLMLEGVSQPPPDRANLAKLDAIGARLAALAEDYPEALIHMLVAANRMTVATGAVLADDLKESLRRMHETADWAYRATRQPTIAPRTAVKYTAYFTGVTADIAILMFAPDAPEDHLLRVRDTLPVLIALGRKWSEQRDDCVEMLVLLVTGALSPNLKSQWKLDVPEGRDAYRRRYRQLYLLAREFLESWEDEVSTRTGKAKSAAHDKAVLLHAILESWATARGVGDTVAAPLPRAK